MRESNVSADSSSLRIQKFKLDSILLEKNTNLSV
jgi:hypothetical protein